MEEEGVLEVRCAGCGDTLEVERGLTEFACPSCATPQALPPELMPPPPRRPRRALPLGLSAAPSRVSCGGCGAVLAVPRGTRRLLACPLCGAEIDIDGRECFAAYSGVQIISPPGTVVLAATSSRLPEEETISRGICVGQMQVGSHNIHRGESPIRLVNETVEGGDIRKKSRPSTVPRSVCVDNVTVEHSREEAHGENGSGSIRRIGIQKATYAISGIAEQDTVEPPIQTACAEPVEVQSCGNTTGWNLKRRKSSETTAKNQNGKKGDLSSSREHLSHSKLVQPQGKRDRDPIRQIASSPDENQFDPSDIDRIITRLCPSALPEKQVSQASSDDLNIDATLPPVSNNHCISQSDCIPHRQHQAVATGSLANQGFGSVQAHEMPQECLNGIVPSDKSSKQKQNPPADILHRQYVQEYPSHDSQSEEAQVGSNHNKYSGHYKNTAKGSRNLLTEGDYFAEQHHTSTNQRVDATTSTPLPTATPLPVATPPSVVSRPPVQRSPPHYKSLEAHHPQGAQSVGMGSINRPPKKRGGRGPTKLIEPRREAYRPVLTPNNIEYVFGTWDVEPPCSKVAYTISTLLKQWHPGSTYVLANQPANEVYHEELILHWHQYHSDTRAIILDEFLQRYKWGPGQEAECLKLFERKLVRQFNSILCDEKRRARVKLVASRKSKEALDAARSKKTNLAGKELKQQHRNPASAGSEDDDPLQWKPLPPEWMQPKWWEMLCEHWASEEVLQVSAQKRKNRYTGGSAQHTAGSRSIAMHRKLMIIENGGKPVSDIEVFNKTHKHNGGKGEFVTEKAKKTVERFKRHLEAGDTEVDLNLVWAQQAAGGRKRGRYYRLQGIIDKARIGAMAKSTPSCVDEVTKKEMFTQDQVQVMISQATQQLNEAWEKRFQSLEQRMQGTVSSEAPQHNPLPCGAQPVAEDQVSHQDASDSSHGGSYQSTTDDDEDDEDYVVN